jgi:hypothetical protein
MVSGTSKSAWMASQVLTEDARRTSETVCEALVMLPVCCKALRGRKGLE